MSALVAITGGSGFVGGKAVTALLEAGYRVRALVRNPGKVEFDPEVEIVEGGLDDRSALDRLCEDAQCVVHCAGVITALDRAGYDAVNVEGTRELLEAATRAGTARFVLVSSLAAREPELSDYGASKRAGETVVRSAGQDMSWAILRPPAVYGPGDRGTLPLIRQLTGKLAIIPSHRRNRFSLIYVDDLAAGIASLVEETAAAFEIFELDDGAIGGHSWPELAAMIGQNEGRRIRCYFLPRHLVSVVAAFLAQFSRLSGKTPLLTPKKVNELYHNDWVCSNNMLDRFAHWAPKTGFAAGYASTVDWYREHGWI